MLKSLCDRTISNAIVTDKVTLIGFGTFDTLARAARIGRNPKTGEEIKIKATVAPKFKAGKALKDAVAGRKSVGKDTTAKPSKAKTKKK